MKPDKDLLDFHMEKLTQDKLKELFYYDPLVGDFIRRKNGIGKGNKKGAVAGALASDGYIQTRINGKIYKNHRLAWLYMYGYFPENDLDHKDKIKHHNWITNLREVSRQCNLRNTGNRKNNISGVKGVSWYKNYKKWKVCLMVSNKSKHLGYHENFDEAVCHRLAGEQCLNWGSCDSDSPAYRYVQKMLNRTGTLKR